MAGAGVAAARGGEGLFYNPAVLPDCDAAELGLSASAYGFQTRTYEDYFVISDAAGNTESAELSVKSISAFPSAASSVYPFELFGSRAAAGFGVFIPEGAALRSAVLFDPDLYPLAREGVLEESRTEYWLNGAAAMDFGLVSVGLGGILQITQIRQLYSLAFFGVGPKPTGRPSVCGAGSKLRGVRCFEGVLLSLSGLARDNDQGVGGAVLGTVPVQRHGARHRAAGTRGDRATAILADDDLRLDPVFMLDQLGAGPVFGGTEGQALVPDTCLEAHREDPGAPGIHMGPDGALGPLWGAVLTGKLRSHLGLAAAVVGPGQGRLHF